MNSKLIFTKIVLPSNRLLFGVRFKSTNLTLEEKEKNKMEAAEIKKKDYLLAEFFDIKENWGRKDLPSSRRPGRSWTKEELRLKGNGDLHKLWFILLKERNMLMTMAEAYKVRRFIFPNPERLDRVKKSMENLEAVVHERNDAFLRLETGESASPPKRTITSFAGFTYQESATEHYEPFEVTGKKVYEIPLLDDQAYLMQKLCKEKEHMKKEIELQDEYLLKDEERPTNLALIRGRRKYFDRLENLPENVVAERKEKLNKLPEEIFE